MSALETRPGRDVGRGSALDCALRAELTRAWTLPWTRLVLLVAFLLVLVLAVLADVRIATSAADGPTGRPLDGAVGLMLAIVAFMVLAAVVVGSGLRSGELRVAANAIPHRGTLAAAQLGGLSLLVLASSVVLFGSDAVVRTWMDPSTPGLLDPSRLRAGVGFCAAALTFALVSATLTLAVRNVVVPVAVLVLTPPVLLGWVDMVAPAALTVLPYAASKAVIQGQAGTEVVLAAPAGFLVLLAWSALSALAFAITMTRRDL